MKDEETIAKYCYELGLKHYERPEYDPIKKSIEIYNICKYLSKKRRCKSCGKIINRMPPRKKSLMASSIYIAGILTGQRRTQNDIAQYIGISTETLRKRYKKIMMLSEYKEEDKIE